MDPAARSFHQSVMVRFLNFMVERLGEAPWGCGCPQPGYNWPLQSSKLLGSATPTHLAVSFMNMQVSSVLAREGAGCGSVGDVPGAWLASAPLSPSLWT